MGFAAENRRDSYEAVRPELGARQREVFDYFQRFTSGLTPWELKAEMDKFSGKRWEIYVLRPRITELAKMGYLEECGRRWYEGTQRNETVWRVAPSLKFDGQGQSSFFL
jgi:hypothetical protein